MNSALLNSKDIKAQASRLGFVACGLAKAGPVEESFAACYRRWLELGYCADMDYMRRNVEMRLRPELLVPGVRTIVSLAMNFMPEQYQPAISLYAQGQDYHDVMRGRMRQLMEALQLEGRCFVDSAPVMERYWAWKSGIGIITREGGFVSIPGYGPTVFLGELFLTQEADHYDEPLAPPPRGRMGGGFCPALTPDGLDARRCISYLTIEHRGPLPDDIRLGRTFYGCDRCMRATPQFAEARPTAEPAFQPPEALLRMTPEDWQALTEEQYRMLFKGSAVKRAKYDGLKRNIERWLKNWVRTSGILLICLLLACCGRNAGPVICQAEQLIQDEPDSALHLLQTINRRNLSGETLARYALVYSIAQDKSGIDVASDSLLRIAYNYYSHHPEDSLYARSQYYMGGYYIRADSAKQGEDCLRTAARCAEERGEYYTYYLALSKLSREIRYSDAALALKYSKKALQVYSEHCPPIVTNKILLLLGIGDAYLLSNQEDSALYYMDMALREANMANDSSLIADILQDKSLVYTKLDDRNQALTLVKAAWDIAPAKDINLATCLASCYADADSARQAQELYTAIIHIGDYKHRYLAYKDLATLSAKMGDETSFLAYSDSAYDCMEAMYKQALQTKSDYFQDLIRLEKENRQQEAELFQKRIFNLCCLMLLIIVVMTGVYIYNNVRNKAKRKLAVERERHQLQEQFAREQHKRELAYKNTQLAMMRTMVMEKYDFHKRIEELNRSGRHITLAPGDWKEISAFLDVTSDGFPKRLKATYPKLQEKDYQFCMLVRLGFSNKNLANIYGIAEVSMKQKLVTYKERLDIPDKSMSFKQFIANF